MFKRLLPLVISMCLLMMSVAVFAQEGSKKEEAKETPAQEKAEHGKQARWEGYIARSNPDKHMFTVREVGTSHEKEVMYDDSTQFTSQEHGSKKVDNITASDIHDNDRIIARGTYDDQGVMHAKMISKRLTQH